MDHFSGIDQPHPLRRVAGEVSELLKEVEDLDPVFMSPEDRAASLAELAALEDRVHLLGLTVLRACDDLGAEAGFKNVAAWQQATQRRDGAAARRDLRLADALGDRWTTTAAAVRDGRVSLEQAVRIVRALDDLSDALDAEWADMCERASAPATSRQEATTREWIADTLARAEAELITLAADHTPDELARLGEGILTLVAPDHADELERRALERAERRARAVTRLTMTKTGDGSTRLSARIPDATAAMLTTYLGALTSPRTTTPTTGSPAAASGEGDSTIVDPWLDPATGRRTPQQQRWGQAFVALLERVTARDVPQHGGLGASVVVTINLDSLRDSVGHGTIGNPDGDGTRLSAGQVRRLACASGLLPAVLGSDSVALDLGRTSRLFNTGQRKAHAITHPTCEADGCTIPAAWTESHHKHDPWARGGTTNRHDLAFLCPWHHHRAHDPTYRTTWHPHGGATFHRRT